MLREEEIINNIIRDVAEKMLAAARTAPKARGNNNLIFAIAKKEDIEKISGKMKERGKRIDAAFFLRDAENILMAPYMLMLAAKINTTNLPYCGLCGFANCEEKRKHPAHPCAFNVNDLGIAIGSAVSIAAAHHIDNRVMYTAGMAVKEMKLLGEEAEVVLCIPLTATSKNPFFDRK